jgi:putative Holliday junction resolvase
MSALHSSKKPAPPDPGIPSRILAIDYGQKRTGIAVTDPFRMIATGLTTVPTIELLSFLSQYCSAEKVGLILIGYPLSLDDTATHATPLVEIMMTKIREKLPTIPIVPVDERYTSQRAVQVMVEGGMKKKDRRKKEMVDQIAATLILQDYLQHSA